VTHSASPEHSTSTASDSAFATKVLMPFAPPKTPHVGDRYPRTLSKAGTPMSLPPLAAWQPAHQPRAGSWRASCIRLSGTPCRRRSQLYAISVIHLNSKGYAQIAASHRAVSTRSQVIIKIEGMEALAQICAETDG
jgi:hypothetical protein